MNQCSTDASCVASVVVVAIVVPHMVSGIPMNVDPIWHTYVATYSVAILYTVTV